MDDDDVLLHWIQNNVDKEEDDDEMEEEEDTYNISDILHPKMESVEEESRNQEEEKKKIHDLRMDSDDDESWRMRMNPSFFGVDCHGGRMSNVCEKREDCGQLSMSH